MQFSWLATIYRRACLATPGGGLLTPHRADIKSKVTSEQATSAFVTTAVRTLALLLVIGAVSLPAVAESTRSLYNRGRNAEARQDYEAAYEAYKQAYSKKPQDVRYRAAFERTRFLAAAAKVHRGQLLRESGNLQRALAEFEAAAAIDPSSFIAQQEIRRTQKMIEGGQEKPQAARPAGPLRKM